MKYIKYILFLALFMGACHTSIYEAERDAQTLHAVVEKTVEDVEDRVEKEQFVWHPSIIQDVQDGFNIKVADTWPLNSLVPSRDFKHQKQYKGFARRGHVCVRAVVRIPTNKPYADFWFHVSYGHTGDSRPLYNREKIFLEIPYDGTKIALDIPPDGATVCHSQGLPIRYLRYHFDKNEPSNGPRYVAIKYPTVPPFFVNQKPDTGITDYKKAAMDFRGEPRQYNPFDQTRWSPLYPGQTGDQAVFGTNLLLPEMKAGYIDLHYWRAELYQEGCRGGHHLNPNGTSVTTKQFPDLVGGAPFFHERSRGESWIAHKGAPWMDRPHITPRWYGWDDQHFSVQVIAQVKFLTDDAGLNLILEDLGETLMFEKPVVEKGTTHHKAGAPRARGRVLGSAAAIAWAVDSNHLRLRLVDHINKMFEIQLHTWDGKNPPISGRSDGVAVWEHGLWLNGLIGAFLTLTEENKVKCSKLGHLLAVFILDRFQQWEGKWGIAYTYDWNWNPIGGPSFGLSRWCMPGLEVLQAARYNFLNQDQKTKLDSIIRQYRQWHTPGAWNPNYRWMIL